MRKEVNGTSTGSSLVIGGVCWGILLTHFAWSSQRGSPSSVLTPNLAVCSAPDYYEQAQAQR